MKKVILLLLICFVCVFVISCNEEPTKIDDVSLFEELFDGAIKYDIRTEKECEDGHIPGFMCMGEKDRDTLIKNIDLVALNKEQKIILIGNEEDVLYILNKLSKKGYKYLYYFAGSYDGYATKKGESFIPETGCGC